MPVMTLAGESIDDRERALRFLRTRVEVVSSTGCWLWTGCTVGDGYGRSVRVGSKKLLAHRAAYLLIVGDIQPSLELDHLCRVRHCVNPAHLEPVTRRENVRRGISPVARNANATHCKAGHPFDETNTRINGRKRVCRPCERADEKQRRAAKAEA